MAEDWKKTALEVGLECGRLRRELNAERAVHQALRDQIEAYAVSHEKFAAYFAADSEEWCNELGAMNRRIELENISRRHSEAAKELRSLLQPAQPAGENK